MVCGIKVSTTIAFILITTTYAIGRRHGAFPSERALYPHGYSGRCMSEQFGCFEGICIPKEWVCDGTADCSDGEDEYCQKEENSNVNNHLNISADQNVKSRPFRSSGANRETLEKVLSLINQTHLASENETTFLIPTTYFPTKIVNKDDPLSGHKEEEYDEDKANSNNTSFSSTSTEKYPTNETTSTSKYTSSVASTEKSQTLNSKEHKKPNLNSTTNINNYLEINETQENSSNDYENSFSSTSSQTPEKLDSNSYHDYQNVSSIIDNVVEDETVDNATNSVTPLLESSITDLQSTVDELLEIIDDLKKQQEEIMNGTFNCSYHNNTNSTTANKSLTDETIKPINKITCPHHFQFISGHCIYVQIYPPMTWYDASGICRSRDGNLLTVHDKEFYENLLKQMNFDRMAIYDFWVGSTNHNPTGVWQWVDGKPMANNDWYLSSPHTSNGWSYQCGYMDGKVFSYINKENCFKQKGFICQFNESEDS